MLKLINPGPVASNATLPVTFTWTSPKNKQVLKGERLTLACAASGWPLPQVTWYRYGGQLPVGRHSIGRGNSMSSI